MADNYIRDREGRIIGRMDSNWLCTHMADNYIRDREGRIIGRMDSNWLRDGTGKLVARYDEGDNRTRNREGKIVGTGDQRLRELDKK